MKPTRRWLLAGLAACVAVPASAQDYPTRPVKIVVGYGPGSGTDILARILAEELRIRLKQPFVVENRPGAASQIASEFVAHAAPDGYTVLLGSNAFHSINPHIYRTLPYDPFKDFTPIARTADFPLVLVVNPKLPIHTPRELLDYIRANPGKVSYASPSRIGQVIVNSLAQQLSLTLNEVDYSSSPTAMQDLAAGREAFGILDFASSQGLIKGGKLRAIAVTTSTRSALAPDLPPLGEALGVPPFDLRAWTGMFGPANLPAGIVDRLSAATNDALANPEVRARLLAAGIEPNPLPPGPTAAFVKDQFDSWGERVKAAHIEPE